MIKLITGKKGSGKTKILIDQINNAVMQNSSQSTASQHSMASLLVCWLATTTSRKSS